VCDEKKPVYFSSVSVTTLWMCLYQFQTFSHSNTISQASDSVTV